MALKVSAELEATCQATAAATAWLERLPDTAGSCAWVAPARRADGTSAVLKVAMPHFEGEDEPAGLREPEQDLEIAKLLRRLWRPPPPGHAFRPLSAMLRHWTDEALARRGCWHDHERVRLWTFARLAVESGNETLRPRAEALARELGR
jgi:hypothetical protein